MTNSSESSNELKNITTDAGFSDANFNFGCQVRGNTNFGVIYLNKTDSLTEVGQINVGVSGAKVLFVNIFIKAEVNKYGKEPEFVIKTSGGNKVADVKFTFPTGVQTDTVTVGRVASFQAIAGETYYIYALNPVSIIYIPNTNNPVGSVESNMRITGVGFGGQCYQGKSGWANAVLIIYDEYYNGKSSTLPSSVGVTVYFQGLPTLLTGNVSNLEIVNVGDIGKEISVSAKLPYNSNGINYTCDNQLNAKIRLIQNDFYGKQELFSEAKLYFHIGGYDYFGIDLLSTQVSSNPILVGQAVLPSGDYNDAAYVVKVIPKKILSNEKYIVKAGLYFWYESAFPYLCD